MTSTLGSESEVRSSGAVLTDSGRQSVPAAGGSNALPTAKYLTEKLVDAELLLCHAASNGVEVDAVITARVLAGRRAEAGQNWTLENAEALIAALTALSARLQPMTAESLRLSMDDRRADRLIRFYRGVAIGLVLLILPFSVATFITSAISGALHPDLVTANSLAVTLSNELRPEEPAAPSATPADSAAAPAPGHRGVATALAHGASQKDVIQHLQDFAATTRTIHERAKQLDFFLGFMVPIPYSKIANGRNDALELNPQLPDLWTEATDRIRVYQDIRYFAQIVDGMVSIFYGAWAACILPVLYALLGTCAYLLRSFEQQLRARTLSESDAHLARFVIAGISGAVIGLFNNINFGQPASVSPLATAFLVGYAVDVFFAFLEGLIQAFNRARPNTQGAGAAAQAESRSAN